MQKFCDKRAEEEDLFGGCETSEGEEELDEECAGEVGDALAPEKRCEEVFDLNDSERGQPRRVRKRRRFRRTARLGGHRRRAPRTPRRASSTAST